MSQPGEVIRSSAGVQWVKARSSFRILPEGRGVVGERR